MRNNPASVFANLSRLAGTALAIIVIALSLASFASAQATETVLFNFGAPHSGIGPQGPLVFDAAGNLYGTTESGGTFGWGTVFKLAPSAVGGWTQTEIHTFTGAKDGGAPYAGLTIDAAGNLYGTTVGGGDLGCTEGGCGTVFELSPNSSGKWTETVLYAFKGTDGAAPQATVVFDALGNLYGTTNAGGQRGAQGYGTVFRLAPSSGGWQESVLHVFADGSDGAYPVAPLVVDAAGNLYGTAAKGGNNCNLSGCGVVFELSLASSGEWRETVLHSFKGGKDGAVPLAGLTLDGSGNLYGTTVYGGVANGCPSSGTAGCGVVFEILPSASGWKENVLHIFTGAQDGGGPGSGITLDAAGNLYGTTEAGGLSTCSTFYTGCGIVFELTPRTGGGWKENVLHAFRDGRDGANPASGLIFDAAGNLYGVSSGGGPKRACSYGCGTAFELTSSTSQ